MQIIHLKSIVLQIYHVQIILFSNGKNTIVFSTFLLKCVVQIYLFIITIMEQQIERFEMTKHKKFFCIELKLLELVKTENYEFYTRAAVYKLTIIYKC